MLDETRWNNLLLGLSQSPKRNDYFSVLVAAYSESQRHYHSAAHVTHCLREFDCANHLARHPQEVEFSIWLHDAVYNPRAHDTEEQSAQLAADILVSVGCADSVVRRVTSLILATKHQGEPQEPDARLLVDVDLSILGQTPEVYDNYEKSVRAEYDWVPTEAYRIGRTQVLRSFTERSRIFQTDWFSTLYERQARQNMSRALAALELNRSSP